MNPAAEALKRGKSGARTVPLHVVDFLVEESGRLLLRDGFPKARTEGMWRGEVMLAEEGGGGRRMELSVWADRPYSSEPTGYVLVAHEQVAGVSSSMGDAAERGARHESLRAFAGGVVHTFNNVMMAVMGNSMLARKDLQKGAPSLHFFSQIDQALQKGSQFCQGLQLCAGRMPVSLASMDLNNLVQRIAPAICRELGCVDRLVLERVSQLTEFDADAALIERALGNLIRNANEAYAGAHAPIHVRTGTVDLDPAVFTSPAPTGVLQKGVYAYIEVVDFGPGMEAGLLSRAFDPFFSTKTGHKGLGLSEVAGVARSHGGAVQLETSPGRGWRIRLLVPIRKAKAVAPVMESTAVRPWRGSGTILVVDDDEAIREVSASMLEMLGFTPLVARDGAEGLRILKAHASPPRLVLLDYSMPDMDGEETLREISKLEATVPVVFMSGHAEGDILSKVGGGQVAGILGKPFAMEKLQSCLRSVLDAKR